MSNQFGYRGYIGSRPIRGTSFPHRVQNLVVRDYANRRKLTYKLSATEYAMPGCYMMLSGVMEELITLEGIILFSLFMLPQRKEKRLEIYQHTLNHNCQLHAALEDMTLTCEEDIETFEDMITVVNILPNTPMGGYYNKTYSQNIDESFVKAALT